MCGIPDPIRSSPNPFFSVIMLTYTRIFYFADKLDLSEITCHAHGVFKRAVCIRQSRGYRVCRTGRLVQPCRCRVRFGPRPVTTDNTTFELPPPNLRMSPASPDSTPRGFSKFSHADCAVRPPGGGVRWRAARPGRCLGHAAATERRGRVQTSARSARRTSSRVATSHIAEYANKVNDPARRSSETSPRAGPP